MFKQRKSIFRKSSPSTPLLVRGLLGLLLLSGSVASVFLVMQHFKALPTWMMNIPSVSAAKQQPEVKASEVWKLVSQSREARKPILEQLAQEKNTDGFRARYLLAADYIVLKQGNQALELLTELERDYDLLAPQILNQRARAYALLGNQQQVQETWQELVKNHHQHPLVVEGLFELGKTDGKYWNQAIEDFPAHPLTKEIINARLQSNPDQLELLLALATHHPDGKDVDVIRDRLVQKYASRLEPEQWETIALGYWQAARFGKAANAYAKSPASPETIYRYARGKQLDSRPPEAISGYLRLISEFPDAPETGLGLRRLAGLTSAQLALDYLNQVISKFPKEAAQALYAKARILDAQNDSAGATQVRQILLTQYKDSEAAAELRWDNARKLAKLGDLQGAWQNAQPITVDSPDSPLAAEAAFWVGKWAKQLGKEAEAKAAWQHTLSRYPESYYGWRSAVLLGWDVGDFTTLREKDPIVVTNPENPALLAGSELVQELYRLGEYQPAWAVWRVELPEKHKMTVKEQFTDGLLRQGVGDYLIGIDQIWSLSQREGEERQQWQELRKQRVYWESLFPFPFRQEVVQWSKKQELNPLLVMSLIRQESRFETDIVSSAGALGLMQVMPETAAWIASSANFGSYDLKNYQDNIKLGTWYLSHNHRQYDNNSMLAIASYNAGAGNVADWIQRFGLSDPDLFIEDIPFPETYGYVKSVLENHWNYLRLYNPEVAKKLADQAPNK